MFTVNEKKNFMLLHPNPLCSFFCSYHNQNHVNPRSNKPPTKNEPRTSTSTPNHTLPTQTPVHLTQYPKASIPDTFPMLKQEIPTQIIRSVNTSISVAELNIDPDLGPSRVFRDDLLPVLLAMAV
jgi:hypothetical protein